MKTIHQLNRDVVAKIAAGEVVDQPSSALKELIENALDAKASDITINLEEGGIKKMAIFDNGMGMSGEDLKLCFLPHATSKIVSTDDLFTISTFGFRGEALASIAAVSDVTIRSRTEGQEHGSEINVNQGTLTTEKMVGMPQGTEISVESLFKNIPARKKFLKDPSTELRSCLEIINRFALGFANVGFKVFHNDKAIVNIPANQSLEKRIQTILGNDFYNECIPVEQESRYGTITGFIGSPQLAERHHRHEFIFINNRSVSDKQVAKIVKDSFGNLIEPKSFPAFILFLTIPYDSVDVNIHPRKEEVAFAYPKEIKELLEQAIKDSLGKYTLTYRKHSPSSETMHSSGMDMHLASLLRQENQSWNLSTDNTHDIAQLNNLYLVTQTPKGMLIVDQHAAHERILFEQFKEAFTKKVEQKNIFTLSEPALLSLSPSDSLLMSVHIELLHDLGFDIETFGNNAFTIRAVPEVFAARDYKTLLVDFLHDIATHGHIKNIDKNTERTLAYLACRTAIKGGDVISKEEQHRLVDHLLDSKTIYTCPHGRPTHVEISFNELERMFKRS